MCLAHPLSQNSQQNLMFWNNTNTDVMREQVYISSVIYGFECGSTNCNQGLELSSDF